MGMNDMAQRMERGTLLMPELLLVLLLVLLGELVSSLVSWSCLLCMTGWMSEGRAGATPAIAKLVL